MYLLPSVNAKLRPLLLDLKPGTRIVSHDFDLGDWQPDRKTLVPRTFSCGSCRQKWRTVAARLPFPPIERLVELELNQEFQQ